MKSVLISIRQEWCDLIAEGKKTVEIRKTYPKLQAPFKVYIYCTKGDSQFCEGDRFCLYTPPHDTPIVANQSVIGEFECSQICAVLSHPSIFAGHPLFFQKAIDDACLTRDAVEEYSDGKDVFGWVISNLKIYDKPKYLGRFVVPSNTGCCNEGKCRGCRFFVRGNATAGIEDDCAANFDTDEYKPLRRPPQSWCYVEEIK